MQVRVELLPEQRGRGYGRRVLPFLEARARDRGRDILQSWTDHRESGAERLPARTGQGSVPRDAATVFASAAGYSLEQVYRISMLDIADAGARIHRMRDDARAASTGYRFVSWVTPTPEDWIDDYAWMKSRMSTDAPSGDAVMDEEVWDADRVRRLEATKARTGMTTLVGAAQHLASGRLSAYTELISYRVPGKPIDQNDTLVLAEHRGHRLGALVKCETLLHSRAVFPEGERIVTGNAEENRPMLAINEEMGFRPARYTGEWQKLMGSSP